VHRTEQVLQSTRHGYTADLSVALDIQVIDVELLRQFDVIDAQGGTKKVESAGRPVRAGATGRSTALP
jgi:hypothetical protein